MTVFNHNGGIVRVRTAEGVGVPGENKAAFSPPSRVLIIDDDRGPRESVRFILKYDYEVHTAASMREGIDRMKAAAPAGGFDCIVLDVRMPERSGIEGLDDIRKLDRDVSVIMFTGYATLDVACEAFRHLANDFVAKPPDADALLLAVGRNVAATRARRRQSAVAHELEDMNKRLSAEIEQSRTLAALGLASDELIHDMNSPLTVLTCCVEMLQMQISRLPQSPNRQWDEMLHYIQTIKNAIGQCVRLADLWRQTRQESTMERGPASLHAFLHGKRRRAAAGRRGVADLARGRSFRAGRERHGGNGPDADGARGAQPGDERHPGLREYPPGLGAAARPLGRRRSE